MYAEAGGEVSPRRPGASCDPGPRVWPLPVVAHRSGSSYTRVRLRPETRPTRIHPFWFALGRIRILGRSGGAQPVACRKSARMHRVPCDAFSTDCRASGG